MKENSVKKENSKEVNGHVVLRVRSGYTEKKIKPATLKTHNLGNIIRELNITKNWISKTFSREFSIIEEIIDYETQLFWIYMQGIYVKRIIGSSVNIDVLLNNALANQTYHSLSELILIRNSFYGSARLIFRQQFEGLMIAKYGDFDSTLVKKWENKKERDGINNISLTNDVFNKIKNVDVSALKEFWKDLSDLSHPTKYSQQVLRAPEINKVRAYSEYFDSTRIIENTYYDLDITFILLMMNYHLLISRLGKKAEGWDLGYRKDIFGVYPLEKEMKSKIRELSISYRKIYWDKRPKPQRSWMLNIIKQYRQNWKLDSKKVA